MAGVSLATSETSSRELVGGKQCSVGRLISEVEGWKIVNIAASWEGTPYQQVGVASVKGIVGDCSGSTNKIYIEAGFPYPYKRTANFLDYVQSSHRFREVELARDSMQAGDVLLWPGHMAIYAPFPEGHPKRKTGVMHRGVAVANDFYTAFNERSGRPYGAFNIKTFRSDGFRVFRYFVHPGELACSE